MAETNIDWTDITFNPWIGCTIASDGCKNCYAKVMYDDNKRGEGGDHKEGYVRWGESGHRHGMSESYWNGPAEYNKLAINNRTRLMVFCASLADVFDNHFSIDPLWRKRLWKSIRNTPYLDWQVLTKRPENIGPALCPPMADGSWGEGWENVWLGTSVENQKVAEARIPALLGIPSRVRFLSCEPLLGPLNIERWLGPDKINWVIVAGESADKRRDARRMKPEWVLDIKEQCERSGAVFFFKQWGNFAPDGTHCGVNGAGGLLDGQIYHAWPTASAPRPTPPVSHAVPAPPTPTVAPPAVKRGRGRPLKGERPMTSTERADACRKRKAEAALLGTAIATVDASLASLGKNDRGLLERVIGTLERAADRRRKALLTVLAHVVSDKAVVRETVQSKIKAAPERSEIVQVRSRRDRDPTDGSGD